MGLGAKMTPGLSRLHAGASCRAVLKEPPHASHSLGLTSSSRRGKRRRWPLCCRRGDQAGLASAASEMLASPVRTLDELRRARHTMLPMGASGPLVKHLWMLPKHSPISQRVQAPATKASQRRAQSRRMWMCLFRDGTDVGEGHDGTPKRVFFFQVDDPSRRVMAGLGEDGMFLDIVQG